MASAIDDLVAQVTRVETVNASVVQLLGTLKAELDSAVAAGDMGQVEQLAQRLGADTDALAAAVTANTPAAPADASTLPAA